MKVLSALLPLAVSGTPNFDPWFVASGPDFSFIVEPDLVWAAGRNNYGQLGLADKQNPKGFETINSLKGTQVSAISAGSFHSLFLTTSGDVYVTGRNNHGQLGTDSSFVDVPVMIHNGTAHHAVGVAAGHAHSLIAFEDGSVIGTGYNTAGQLGDNSVETKNKWTLINISSVKKIEAGYDFSYFLKADGELWATGQNLGGQLGDGTGISQQTPKRVLTNVKSMSAGESHGLFLMKDGRVFGTGANFDGQLGDGTSQRKFRSASIFTDTVKDVSVGGDSSCISRGRSDELFCFGSNRDGQLGLGDDVATSPKPAKVPKVSDDSHDFVASMSMSISHSVFLTHPGDVFASGSNMYGQLGLMEVNETSTPTYVMNLQMPETTQVPTPAPTPAPTPQPTEAPPSKTTSTAAPGRDTSSAKYPDFTVILGIGGGVLLVGAIILCFSQRNIPAPPPETDIERMRMEMTS